MKKKILTMCLVVALAATAVVGGTLAYFTDTDGAKNVMTVGQVSIVQNETDSKGDEFVDNQKMYPVTGEESEAAERIEYGDVMKDGQNWIDKIVTVTNDGTEDAYVRTLIAFKMLKDENGEYMDPIDAFSTHALDLRTNHGLCYNWNPSANGDSLYWPLNTVDGLNSMKDCYGSENDYTHVQIGDEIYVVAVYYYTTNGDSMVKPNETTHPSLKNVGLEKTVTNEQAKLFENYEILVVSQAVQTAGFTTDTNGNGSYCDDALNEAFGAVETATAETLRSWFAIAQ